MEGFTSKALIICPSMEDYENMLPAAKNTFKEVLDVLIEYLKAIYTEPYCFTNDELALEIRPKVEYVEAFLSEDKLFASREIEGMDNIPNALEEAEGLAKTVRKSYPVKRGLSDDERFEIVKKRCKAITEYWINKFQWVITFEPLSKEIYKVKTGKDGDERIVWRIRKEYYRVESYMSGSPIDIEYLIFNPMSRLPIYKWEVKELIK